MGATDQDRVHTTGDLPAGSFSTWLAGMTAALQGERDADVPCGTCTACCTSSQFVHIGPDETDALAAIPAALQFPAPGLPEGHVVLGYDERGHCPMLVDGACSIYEHRPRTCRTYDCRILAATGVDMADDGKPAIAQQVARWRFDISTNEDGVLQAAVHAATGYLRQHRADAPPGIVPTTATALAVAAVAIHEQFLGEGGDPVHPEPELADVVAALTWPPTDADVGPARRNA